LRLYLKSVGKTFHFECPQCHYRAKISGGPAQGLHCGVQTIICRDCRELFDVFTRMRRPADRKDLPRFPTFYRPEIPPVILQPSSFQPPRTTTPLVWQDFQLTCPAQPKHFVEAWNDPGRCPRCGNYLEKNGFAFRLWD
jgi:hypothetical protein